jgi:hypothetical protein
MKKALPVNVKISKDAKETVQECLFEFISFVTGEASDKCQREKRKGGVGLLKLAFVWVEKKESDREGEGGERE